MPAVLRQGDRGEAVRDLHQRLVGASYDVVADEPGTFGAATERAVRALQEARGLRVDGIVGRQTWSALVESGYSLGDRLLYLRRPMVRGDDVADLQHRLNALGFDAGREDGILGDDTRAAVVEFQRAVGLPGDGICGATTIAALDRVGSFAAGSAAGLRERLRSGPPVLAGQRVYVATTPGLAALGEQVTHGLLEAGATAVLDASGNDDSFVAGTANRFQADLLIALRGGDAPECRCAYFASAHFQSDVGRAVATSVQAALASVLPTETAACGKAYAILRETQMPAVVCELVPDGDVDALRGLVARAGDAARAMVAGVQRSIEQPDDANP
jgi:N-acetylmuramoyl-L-alanine amidase